MTRNNDNTGWRLAQTVTIPGEPVGKGRPRFNRRTGRPFTPAKTVEFEKRIGWLTRNEPIDRPTRRDCCSTLAGMTWTT